jgi:hypothetical protein
LTPALLTIQGFGIKDDDGEDKDIPSSLLGRMTLGEEGEEGGDAIDMCFSPRSVATFDYF